MVQQGRAARPVTRVYALRPDPAPHFTGIFLSLIRAGSAAAERSSAAGRPGHDRLLQGCHGQPIRTRPTRSRSSLALQQPLPASCGNHDAIWNPDHLIYIGIYRYILVYTCIYYAHLRKFMFWYETGYTVSYHACGNRKLSYLV